MNNDYFLFIYCFVASSSRYIDTSSYRRFVISSLRHVVASSCRQVVTSTFRHFDGGLFLARRKLYVMLMLCLCYALATTNEARAQQKTATPLYWNYRYKEWSLRTYIDSNSCRNSSIPITLTGGNLICLSTSKWWSSVTMYLAFTLIAQSTNLLSSGSALIIPNRK